MRLPIFALAVSAFAIGTTEFVIMGLVPDVAGDLGVSIPQAGLLISGYAMGVVIGGPLLAVATSQLARKHALLWLMALFVVGNLLCALAPSYSWLMTARVITSLSHGSFFGSAAIVAAHLAPPRQSTRAIALMFSGLTIANIIGVPLGTLLGQNFGWRATFWAVVLLGALAFAAIARLVPAVNLPTARLGRELRVLRQTQVWLALAMTVFGFGGVFTVFTFITPMLEHEAQFAPNTMSILLGLFGLGATVGTLLGGRLADWKLMPALIVLMLTLIMLYLVFAYAMHLPIAAMIGVFALGLFGFSVGPGLQARSQQQARAAPLLASTLNQSAFNLGNAGGAFLGAHLLAAGHSYPSLPLAAAVVTVIGLGLTVLSAKLERRATTRTLAVCGDAN
ncbi:MAG: transporter, family, inner rane transport protein [Nevskia sp.]|nr:transporter, family, inner rane transport protein [Nevskia sp.]